MKRRRVVRLLALGAAGLAGCGGETPNVEPSPPTPSPTPSTPTPRPEVHTLGTSAADIEFAETDDGTVAITLPVVNEAESRKQAQMVVEIAANDTRHTATRQVAVDAGGRETYTVTFDVDWDAFRPNVRGVTFYAVESS